MKYHILFLLKLGKMSQNLSSAAVMIGALRVNKIYFSSSINHSKFFFSIFALVARLFGGAETFVQFW